MIPPGADENPPIEAAPPEPPYSLDQLADLHAGVYSDEAAAHMCSRIAFDPEAQRVLAALDATRADLAESSVEPVDLPNAVRTATASTLGTLATSPPRHRFSGTVLAAAAAAVLVVAVIAAVLITVTENDDAPPPQAGQTPPTTHLEVDAASLLTVLGRTDGQPFASAAALRRCTAANGVPEDTGIVGSGRIHLDGHDAAVVLLATGVAGRFEALVVGLDCDTGHPSTLSRTVVGGS